MKKFLSENWFKLMTGTSMLVFSFGFLLYAVSPTYANNSNKTEKQKVEKTESLTYNDPFIIESNGYVYMWKSKTHASLYILEKSLGDPISKANKRVRLKL